MRKEDLLTKDQSSAQESRLGVGSMFPAVPWSGTFCFLFAYDLSPGLGLLISTLEAKPDLGG